MRKIKNAKKKKKEVIEIPDSVMKKIMEILKKLCNDEDKFTLISYLINSNYVFEDFFLFKFKQSLFEFYYTTNRNEKFIGQKTLERSIHTISNHYKSLLNPGINLEIATILFDINELLTKYANIPNKILVDTSKAKTEKAEKFVKCLVDLNRGFKGNIIELLGDDPCVYGKFKLKFIEVTNWITNAFYNRINNDNINELFSYDALNKTIEDKVNITSEKTNKMLRYSTWAFKNWKNLCYLINELTARCSLVEIKLIELQEIGVSKKEITHLKSTVTRCFTLINNLYNLLNYGEDSPTEETIEEVKEVYGMLPIIHLKGVMALEKLIA